MSLKSELQNLIHMDLTQIEQTVSPASLYFHNDSIKDQVIDIIRIICQDRDGNQNFTVNDLVLLSKDIVAMTSLITALILMINSVPHLKIKYKEGETEELVLKLLIYLFLVIIPKQTNTQFTEEEKEALLNVSILVYTLLLQTHIVEKIVTKVSNWLSTKCTCLCFKTPETQMDELKSNLSRPIK